MDYTTNGLKNIELDILKAFIGVCKKNNLRYYLLGGSCLGAIRHHGYIPWDDDIDVGLPRKDYNKLMEIGQADLPDYYFLQNYITDPEYYVNFAKIRDSRTTFIESSIKQCHINHGVYIDVFPLDYYPEKGVLAFKNKDLILKSRISSEYDIVVSKKMKVLQLLARVIVPDVHIALRKRDALMQSINNSSIIANICGAWQEKEISPIDWFGEGVEVDFEGMKAIVPQEYDKYLTKLYGDYMTPPPIEKRKGHHFTEVIDLDKPYTEYID